MLRRPRPALLAAAGAGVLAVGLVLGPQVRDAVSASDDTQSLRKIEEAYEYITRSYVERVDSAQLAEDAIKGMLDGLDPHSVYISAREMSSVRESFAGSFQGIGIYYEFVPGTAGRDSLVVLMPIAGGPSDDAGLMAGDRIVQIGDTTAVGLDTDDVQRFLKGPRGTSVSLVVARPGYPEALRFTIERDEIPLNTVIAHYMIDDQTGYIRLQRFAATSAQEIRTSIDELRGEGMTRLVFDLRDNGGGLLEQAYQIADEFLPAGDMIVYTESRFPNNRRQYRATAGGHFEAEPVMVLVNENSASASEIVSGALQDHDRAVVVGETTFGKGLVQVVRPMPYGTALKLTVSRYTTPSGREIQRLTYAQGTVATAVADADRRAFRTDAGRPVRSGGGIEPDVAMPLGEPSALEEALVREAAFLRFANRYAADHPDVGASFRVTDAVWAAFRQTLAGVAYETPAELAVDALERDLAAAGTEAPAEVAALRRVAAQDKARDAERHAPRLRARLRQEVLARAVGQRGLAEAALADDAVLAAARALVLDPARYGRALGR